MQFISITSEALQATVRRLLPSQQGFGEDLQASNVITPIIDLTKSAEGSELPTSLQQAQAFGNQTAFNVQNSSAVLNNTGFYRVQGIISAFEGSTTGNATVTMSDGLSNKLLYQVENFRLSSSAYVNTTNLDFIVFLRANDSVTFASSDSSVIFVGSYRQVADVNGNLVVPIGYTPQ